MQNANDYVYKSKFKAGSRIRIAPREYLEEFMRTWKYHHKLSSDQLKYGGQRGEVLRVSFYHGGDVLYELVDIPGIWHEQCLHLDVEKTH